jgi:hypothetical protein
MKKNMKGGVGPVQVQDNQQVQEGVQYLSVGDLATAAAINTVGLKVDDKSIENLLKFTNNPVAVEKVRDIALKVTNEIAAPVLSSAITQMVEPVNEATNKIKDNVLNIGITSVPIIGPGLEDAQLLLKTGSDVLDVTNKGLNVFSNSIQKIQDEAEKLDPMNQLNNQIESLAIPINNNQVESLAIPINNNQVSAAAGGGRILSRIQKSVKNFMGKSKKITHKNTNTKINKKRSMKGGTYNKNKKRVFSQKGGQILSRINESLRTFNRM